MRGEVSVCKFGAQSLERHFDDFVVIIREPLGLTYWNEIGLSITSTLSWLPGGKTEIRHGHYSPSGVAINRAKCIELFSVKFVDTRFVTKVPCERFFGRLAGSDESPNDSLLPREFRSKYLTHEGFQFPLMKPKHHGINRNDCKLQFLLAWMHSTEYIGNHKISQ